MEYSDYLPPGQYTYDFDDFDYTYTFGYKLPSNFSLCAADSPALSALSVPLFRLRTNSSYLSADGADDADDADDYDGAHNDDSLSSYSDSSYTDSSNRSHMSSRYSSSSSSSSSGSPCNPSIDNIASIGTHMYDNPGTISSATTAYVSRERLAELEYLEKNISTIISEEVRKYYDGYTVSSSSEEKN
jgi:hypothetical protein